MLGRDVASTRWGREGTRGVKGPETIHRPFCRDGHRSRVESTPGREDSPRHRAS